MSASLMGRVFRLDLPGHLKLLLLALADEASDEGRGICLAQTTIALKVGASDRAVRTNLEELRRQGLIHRLAHKHPKYRTDQYEINVAALWHRAEDVAGRAPRRRGSPQVAAPATEPHRKMSPVHRPEVQRPTDRKSSVPGTGSPLPTTQELPVEATQEGAVAPPITNPLAEILLAPDSTAQYLISRMSEPWQKVLSPPALVKLGQEFGAPAVLDALRNIREDEPAPNRAYPYLAAICRRLAEGAA